MKKVVFLFLVLTFLSFSSLFCGAFDKYYMPMTNPVLNGDARNITMIRPIFIYQNLPDKVRFKKSVKNVLKKYNLYDASRKLDGDMWGIAVQFTYAINERLSIVATKDGYFNCNPDSDSLVDDGDGFGDLAAGLQYSFIYDEEKKFILSGRLTVELPTGDDDVYQENGDGDINLQLLFLKGIDNFQFSGTIGIFLPLDKDNENTLLYDSWHFGYNFIPKLHGFIELNHFYTVSSGSRDLHDINYHGQPLDQVLNAVINDTTKTDSQKAQIIASSLKELLHSGQKDDVVAAVASFNACDIVNLGGAGSDEDQNLATLAFGVRVRLFEWLDIGASYEFNITGEESSLIDDRFMADAIIRLKF